MNFSSQRKKIVHIVDDVALGGVTRLLDSLLLSLTAFDHRQLHARTRFALPPSLDADVIVVHFTIAWNKLPFLVGLRRACSRARIVLVEHSYTAAFEVCNVEARWRFRKLLRTAYGFVDQVVAVSSGQKHWMLAAKLAPDSHISVIPCVPDLSPFLAIAAPRPHDGPMILGAFGRYSRQKGFDTLIEAMRLVPQPCAQLILAGYGEDEAALRAAATGLPHVHIQGRVDPVDFLSRVDAIVIPSRWEAGAVSCWELRAAARPAVVADVDGLPEQMPRERGLIVAPENAGQLAKAIGELAAMDRVTMGRSARQSTLGAFERALAAWATLFDGEPMARRLAA